MTQDFQGSFAKALLDPDPAPPPDVVSHRSARPHGRFAVYRNNVMVALVGALEARFPATRRIVGEDFFAAMARMFAAANPPRAPMMIIYGDSFPDFIAGFEPAAEVPYLADVARLEAARTRAYHAADAEPLAQDVLVGAVQEDAESLGFVLHPSFEIVTSPFPIVTIWAMNSGETEVVPIEDWDGEAALVLRPRLDVEVRRLPRCGLHFFEALRRGAPLGVATRMACAETPGFDLTENLVALLGSELVVGMHRAT